MSAQFSCKFSLQEIAYLVKISEGDLRKAITFLQSATRLTGGKEVSEDVITDIAGVIPAATIDGIFTACHSGSFDKLEAVVKNLIDEGHAATQLVNQLHDAIIENENLSDKHKSIITEKLAVSCKHYTSTTTNFFWYVLVIFLFPFVGSRQVLGRWCR